MNKKASAINIVWLFLIVSATVVAAYTGNMEAVTNASFESAKKAVTLAIGLVGAMALWLGIMKVLEVAGVMRLIARAMRPLMIRLFPDVPTEHPAMSAMLMNMAANSLGLCNAATPMGIKAMQELDKINPVKGTATNSMCLFLAINTSNVAILPLGVMAIRAGAGASNPGSIIVPTFLATLCSTIVAIIVAKLFILRQKKKNIDREFNELTPSFESALPTKTSEDELVKPSRVGKIIMLGFIVAFIGAIILRLFQGNVPTLFSADFFKALSHWMIPFLICFFLLFGYFRGVKVYEVLTDGAKEGFSVALKIIPFLVAIFVAIGMFKASGALDLVVSFLDPVTSYFGMPAEALSVGLMRPLSGSGSFGIMSEIVASDPNSFLSYLVSTMQGSTETTFYVLAVYFGSVGIKRTRHALPAALCADAAGIIAALTFCKLFYS
jgi:spore maturation protein SpmA